MNRKLFDGVPNESDEKIIEFGSWCYKYILTYWNILEEQFDEYSAAAHGGDEESGAYVIINTRPWLYMALVVRDSMDFPGAKEFYECVKPRKNHKKFYKFLKSRALHKALMDLGKDPSDLP